MTNDTTSDRSLRYVTSADDLEEGERVIVDVDGREIAVFNISGEYHALANYCTHQGGPVCEGMITGSFTASEDGTMEYVQEDEIIACPWHGWEYDIRTGKHLASDHYRLPTYEVTTRDGDLYLEL